MSSPINVKKKSVPNPWYYQLLRWYHPKTALQKSLVLGSGVILLVGCVGGALYTGYRMAEAAAVRPPTLTVHIKKDKRAQRTWVSQFEYCDSYPNTMGSQSYLCYRRDAPGKPFYLSGSY